MKAQALRRIAITTLAAGLLLVPWAQQAAAHHDPDPGCLALGGSVVGRRVRGRAQPVNKGGSYTIVHTLRLSAGVVIDATLPLGTGITITITGAGNDLIMEPGSVIETNDGPRRQQQQRQQDHDLGPRRPADDGRLDAGRKRHLGRLGR